jgi:hypothetical protein
MNFLGRRTDAIVVLGRGVRDDGSLGQIARARVDSALEIFRHGVARRMIFSGRHGLTANDAPPATEAAAMAAYAISRGLPRKSILLEEESRDTIGNAWFVRTRFLDPNGWTSLRVVTSDFHVPRAGWVFRKVLGPGFDVAFTPVSSERFGSTIAVRARDESDIAAFLAGWMSDIADGDLVAIARLIYEEHPGYASDPSISRADLESRVAAITRQRRAVEHRPRPVVVRRIEERLADF